MIIKIVPFGDMGSTIKAAQMLADNIDGSKICDSLTDAADADKLIVGVNVHFGKFNKRFIKELKRVGICTPVHIYIVGAQIERSEDMIDKMRKLVPSAVSIRYIWGELNADGARGLKKFAIQSFIDGRRKDRLPKPRLLEKEIKALAREIQN